MTTPFNLSFDSRNPFYYELFAMEKNFNFLLRRPGFESHSFSVNDVDIVNLLDKAQDAFDEMISFYKHLQGIGTVHLEIIGTQDLKIFPPWSESISQDENLTLALFQRPLSYVLIEVQTILNQGSLFSFDKKPLLSPHLNSGSVLAFRTALGLSQASVYNTILPVELNLPNIDKVDLFIRWSNNLADLTRSLQYKIPQVDYTCLLRLTGEVDAQLIKIERDKRKFDEKRFIDKVVDELQKGPVGFPKEFLDDYGFYEGALQPY